MSAERKAPKRLSSDEKTTILVLARKGESINEIARKLDRNKSVVSRFLSEMVDTTVLADATLKAGMVKLAERVVKKAEVREAIDVLSRPNIGILAPMPSKGGVGSGGGIEVSVGVNSCGTVVAAKVKIDGQEQGIIEGARGVAAELALPVPEAEPASGHLAGGS